jgi:hypothetical protein
MRVPNASSTFVWMQRSAGRLGRAAVIGLAMLGVAVLASSGVSASAESTSAHAASAKQKRKKVCKKRRKRGVPCKNRYQPPVHIPLYGPRTVTATWDSTADIDLHVYDLEGHQAGKQNGAVVDDIPGTTFSGNDTDGFGPESFDDPAGRPIGYLICWIGGPHANVTVTDTGMGGGTHTDSLGPDGSDAYTIGLGYGYLPDGAHC